MSGKTSSDYDALFEELIRYKSIVLDDTFKDKKQMFLWKIRLPRDSEYICDMCASTFDSPEKLERYRAENPMAPTGI